MNQDEIDKIIADAVADSKKQSKWHRPGKGSTTSMMKVRQILNTLFMLGFVAAIILYFAMPDNRVPFFCVGFGAMLLKIIEFYIRFML